MAKTTLTALKAPATGDDAKKEDKLGGQAGTIVNAIIAKVGLNKPIDRADLCKELEASGKLNTKQTVERVVGYYQPRMVENGWISAETEKAEPKPKAAKADGKGKAEPSKAGADAGAA